MEFMKECAFSLRRSSITRLVFITLISKY